MRFFFATFAAKAGAGTKLEHLGEFCLRGICRPIAVYGFAEHISCFRIEIVGCPTV
jgi:hypothetical protein